MEFLQLEPPNSVAKRLSARTVLLATLTLLAAIALSTAPLAACPWHRSLELFGEWGPLPDGTWPADLEAWDSLLRDGDHGVPISVPVDAPASQVGTWLPPQGWPVIAIHAALLPTGDVLAYSYPNSDPGSNARLWDPETGVFEDVTVGEDLFCSGLSLLEDGHVYATGGNDDGCDFQGLKVTHDFDPFTATWTELDEMQVGRWYPQNTTLEDGRVIITSGLGRDCEITSVMELYDPSSNSLTEVDEGFFRLELYPRTHLLSDGRIASIGPTQDSHAFELGGSWEYVDTTVTGSTWDGTTVRVPGTVDELMLIGGSTKNSAERIDFSDPDPEWRETGSMNFARSHANSVILPDRRVLVLGGGTTDLYGDPVLNAEIYDPENETWTLLPAQFHPRMYHSTALLLPDGRVISAGQDSGNGAFSGEIYEPDYLFRGPRPEIVSAPGAVRYGQTFEVRSFDAPSISSIALLRLGTVTHSVNNGQQYVGLEFERTAADTLTAITPQHGNLAPPGYYMLFLLNEDGIPSEAEMIRLGAADLQLDAPNLERGETATLVVNGANPDEEVRFGLSVGGLGAGPCPDAMGGECLDLAGPVIQLGTGMADPSGRATLAFDVPSDAPLTEVGIQAVVLRGPGGADTVTSNARAADVDP